MKRKGLPVAILALALMVALGGLGVVYGAWSQNLTVTGTVNTATFGVHFTQSSLAPSVTGDATVSCTGLQGGETADMSGNVGGVYPGHGCTFTAKIQNTSSIPVTVSQVSVTKPAWMDAISSIPSAGLGLAGSSTSTPQTFKLEANTSLTGPIPGTQQVVFNLQASQMADSTVASMVKYYNGVVDNGGAPTFARSTSPFTGIIGTQNINGDGSVTVTDTTGDTASIFSGFDIYYGRWGDLKTKTVTIIGSGSWEANLWFDTTGASGNGDGDFFAWSGGTPNLFTGWNGDTRIMGFTNNSNPSKDMSTINVTTVSPAPGHSVTDDTLVAIWIGTGPGQTATISSVTFN